MLVQLTGLLKYVGSVLNIGFFFLLKLCLVAPYCSGLHICQTRERYPSVIPGGKTDPVGVVRMGVWCKNCQIKHLELPTVATPCAVESAVTENELMTFTKYKTMFT